MKTIKDYAREKGVSYEAVRKQTVKFSGDLEGHITKDGRTSYLDDYAMSFLDRHRGNNRIVVLEATDEEVKRELQTLKDEIEAYKSHIMELQKQLLDTEGKYITVLEEQKAIEADHKRLLLDTDQLKEDNEKLMSEALAERAKRDKLEEELQKANNDKIIAQHDAVMNFEAKLQAETDARELRDKLRRTKDDLTRAEDEAGSYYPSLFGFYRKKKPYF